MRTPLQEKQALTDTLGRLNEDRFFARRAADQRRALLDLELDGSTAGDRQARADRSKRSLAVALIRPLGLVALLGFSVGLIAVFVMRA